MVDGVKGTGQVSAGKAEVEDDSSLQPAARVPHPDSAEAAAAGAAAGPVALENRSVAVDPAEQARANAWREKTDQLVTDYTNLTKTNESKRGAMELRHKGEMDSLIAQQKQETDALPLQHDEAKKELIDSFDHKKAEIFTRRDLAIDAEPDFEKKLAVGRQFDDEITLLLLLHRGDHTTLVYKQGEESSDLIDRHADERRALSTKHSQEFREMRIEQQEAREELGRRQAELDAEAESIQADFPPEEDK